MSKFHFLFAAAFIAAIAGCQSPDKETVKAVMPNVTESSVTARCTEEACVRVASFSRKKMWSERSTIETKKFEKLISGAHKGKDQKVILHVYYAEREGEFMPSISGLSYDEALKAIRGSDMLPSQVGMTTRGEDGIKAKSSTDPDWMSLILGIRLPSGEDVN